MCSQVLLKKSDDKIYNLQDSIRKWSPGAFDLLPSKGDHSGSVPSKFNVHKYSPVAEQKFVKV